MSSTRRASRLRVWQAMALIGVVIVVAFWSCQGAPPATRQEAREGPSGVCGGSCNPR